MSACEHCWSMSQRLGIEYQDQLKKAEDANAPCTQNTLEGARLRAGQWWDEKRQMDKREMFPAAGNEGKEEK